MAARGCVASLLLVALLAGCASKGHGASPASDSQPSGDASLGAIRGLVVDTAIRPLAGVQVALLGGPTGKDRSADSDAQGRFAFEGVAPGSHFIAVSKPGYMAVREAVQVAPGSGDPPLVKVQLTLVPGAAPYVQAFKFNGFLECGLSAFALCSAGNGLTCGIPFVPCSPNVTNDAFTAIVPIERPPWLIQSEMVWKTTTAASDQLWLWHSRSKIADGSYNGSCRCWAQGPSPLLLDTNRTQAQAEQYGVANNVELRVFTGSVNGTRNPLDANGCYPATPDVPGVGSEQYCGGAGYSVEQGFTIYTHVFYGYLPTPGWRFTQQPDVPPPPA